MYKYNVGVCKFCLNLPKYVPQDNLEKLGIKDFFCFPCNSEILYRDTGKHISTALYTTIDDKHYRWNYNSYREGHLYRIKSLGIPGKTLNKGLSHLMTINDPSEYLVTPENINAKIQAWLAFL